MLYKNLTATDNFHREIEFLRKLCCDSNGDPTRPGSKRRHHDVMARRPLDPAFAKELRDLERLRDEVYLTLTSLQNGIDGMIAQHEQASDPTRTCT